MSNTKTNLESLLFVSAKPMSIKQLAGFLDTKEKEVEQLCEELLEEYNEQGRGWRLIKNGDKYQMVSAPESAEVVQKFIEEEIDSELSKPSLEALTIIAYRGPISKMDIERIRGINCSLILRNLLVRGLIEAKEQHNNILYTVSFDFLRFLGLSDTGQLPDYEKLHQHETIEQMLAEPAQKI